MSTLHVTLAARLVQSRTPGPQDPKTEAVQWRSWPVPRGLGAALTTNGGRSEEELLQVGKLYGRRSLGAKKRWSVFVTRLPCDGGSFLFG